MKMTVRPSRARGTLAAPPSKSMAHRLLLCAGLAPGESVISGVAPSEDMLATMDCLNALGARCRMEGSTVFVSGTDPARRTAPAVLPCRECGSTLRFMIPVAMMSDAPAVFTGSTRLLQRPLTVYEEMAARLNLPFSRKNGEVSVAGPLPAGTYPVDGSISSQFISGLLLALPLTGRSCTVSVIPPLESRPYTEMTVQAQAAFGVRAEIRGDEFFLPGGQRYTPAHVSVEGDWSNAAFLMALNLTGGEITVTNLSEESLQGDRVCRAHLEALSRGYTTIDLSDCPDLGPILFTAAALCRGARFTGTRRLRIKESDRAAAMAEELGKCGAHLTVLDDEVRVEPAPLHAPAEPLCGHNDHRVVMALTVLLTRLGGTVTGAEAVRKSYPDFFDRLADLGIDLTREEGDTA